MTPAEYSALAHPRLSHPARSLYTPATAPLGAGKSAGRLNYPELGRALAVVDPGNPGGFSYQVNARQLTELLDELMEAELLQVEAQADSEHYHQCPFQLPLLSQRVQPSAGTPVPDAPAVASGRRTACSRTPVRGDRCQLQRRGSREFIAYWLGRPEVFDSQHQWMLKFIRALKSRRYARRPATVVTGYQQVAPAPVEAGPSRRAQEMIDEAKRLAQAQEPEND